ncbi:MAG: GNAT family N-acetyltransferase [Acidobacteria bacterium]|nr:GNAT family N-acetyltransferase [Acidobacteriota bacterium]
MNSEGYYPLEPGRLASVVTYLEMTEPPPARPAVLPPDCTLRWEPNPDADDYLELFLRVGTPWLWFGHLRLPKEELADLLKHSPMDLLLLRRQNRGEGLLVLDRREFPEVELSYFGVTERMMGTTAARAMINAALERVWSLETSRFWLHTCTLDHPRALAFYRRTGFRPYKRAVEVFQDPRLSGHLPSTAVPEIPLL